MNIQDQLRLNRWSRLTYHDPREVLLRLRPIQMQAIASDLPNRAKGLRTHELKSYREWREAALFCFGLSEAIGTTVSYATFEEEDYDVVARWTESSVETYAAVQIKEVVPGYTNPAASLSEVIEGLAKYPGSQNTVVAIHFNRRERLELSEIILPPLHVGAVWLFGAISDDESRWFLYGDLLKSPQPHEFAYPT